MDGAPPSRDELPELASMLARSFETCPAWQWLLPPQAPRRSERMERFFGFLLGGFYLEREERECLTDGTRGAMLLDPPGGWQMGNRDTVRSFAAMVPVFRRYLPRAARAFGVFDAMHPRDPHYSVSVLGVAPEARRDGVADALVRRLTDRCDAEGMPAYVDTGRPRSRDFYVSHGFDVREEISLPGGGPPVWGLWREPGR